MEVAKWLKPSGIGLSIRGSSGKRLPGRGRWGRLKGPGEHDGLVIAAALAGWWASRRVRHSL